ncbi:MAG: hypothetical protein RI985_1537, partial [Chloroflexota bacterium]
MRALLLLIIGLSSLVACMTPPQVSSPTALPSESATATPSIAESTATVEIVTPSHTPIPTDTSITVPVGGELIFIQQGELVGFGIETGTTRPIFADVADFVVSPDNSMIAII